MRLTLLAMALMALPYSALALEVEPLRLELAIPAEQPTGGGLEIRNTGDKSVEVRLSSGPYRFMQPNLKLPSCQDWLRFEPERFTLAAGATATVAYVISPPENLSLDAAAEYLGAIQVDQFPAEPAAKGAAEARVTVVPRLALPVYLMIRGRERVQVELSEVRLEAQEGEQKLLRIDTTLRNRGTVHTRPSGTFALFQGDGQVHRAGPLGKGLPLLPTASLTLTSYLPLPPPGPYRLVTTVELPEGGDLLQKETRVEITEDGGVVTESKP